LLPSNYKSEFVFALTIFVKSQNLQTFRLFIITYCQPIFLSL